MTPQERVQLIDQLDKSFTEMPNWVKSAVVHSMGAPDNNPETGLPFKSFREVIEMASNDSLMSLRDDFESNGDLRPGVGRQL